MSDIRNINSFVNRLRKNRVGIQPNKNKKASTASATSPSTRSRVQLRATLRTKLHTIDLNDPAGLIKAKKVFVESTLVWEFGEAILLDPATHELVSSIIKEFSDHSTLKGEFDNMIKEIVK